MNLLTEILGYRWEGSLLEISGKSIDNQLWKIELSEEKIVEIFLQQEDGFEHALMGNVVLLRTYDETCFQGHPDPQIIAVFHDGKRPINCKLDHFLSTMTSEQLKILIYHTAPSESLAA